jgi:23S rRNA A2030 N6-methylase RlmJ
MATLTEQSRFRGLDQLMSNNIQNHNVGNLGDIIKHTALLQLACLIWVRNERVPINYVDTHAYVLRGKLANENWWRVVTRLRDNFSAYQAYINLEEPVIDSGEYLCSTGITVACISDVRLYLSEAHPDTRNLLRHQLAAQNIVPAILLEDVNAWQSLATDQVDKLPLLALIDPFVLTDDIWRSACDAIAKLHNPHAHGLLEVFTYDDTREKIDWPNPPRGWIGPVAQIAMRPFFLAVYTAGDITDDAMHCLTGLGWKEMSE